MAVHGSKRRGAATAVPGASEGRPDIQCLLAINDQRSTINNGRYGINVQDKCTCTGVRAACKSWHNPNPEGAPDIMISLPASRRFPVIPDALAADQRPLLV